MQWTVFWMWAKTTTWSVNSMCVGNIPKGFTLAMHTNTLTLASPTQLRTYQFIKMEQGDNVQTDGWTRLGLSYDMYVLWTKYMFVWLLECCRGVHTRFLPAYANGFDHRCVYICKYNILYTSYLYLIYIHTCIYLPHTCHSTYSK